MPNSNDVASSKMLWERILSLLVVGVSVLGGSRVADTGVVANTSRVSIDYYRNEAATAAALRDGGWLTTGDIARMDTQGRLFIVGRTKDLKGELPIGPTGKIFKIRLKQLAAKLDEGELHEVAGAVSTS
jgi:hypothetical protein